jgi:hypothetical protein
MKRLVFASIALLFALNVSAQSYISKDSTLEKPFLYFSVAGFFTNITTSLRIDSDIGVGTELSLEETLKMESNVAVLKANLILQASPRSQFGFVLTGINRDKTFQIEDTLRFRSSDFPLGANARLFFNTRFYAFTWRYSIWNKPNWNAGLSLGARAVSFHTGIDANVQGRRYNESARFTAPAALIGIHGAAYLSPRFLGRYTFDYLHLTIAGVDIKVLESNTSLQYFFLKNVGVGVAYSVNEYLIQDIPFNSDFDGRVLFRVSGFNLFASCRW